MDKFIDGKFSNQINQKDGFAILECRNIRVKKVLKFLVPILYSEKPIQVTITIGNMIRNTILGAKSRLGPSD